MDDSADSVAAFFDAHNRRRRTIETAVYYRWLKSNGSLRQVLLSEYRCQSGCLLLQLFQTPTGVAFFIPRYKLSRNVNAASSSESGRRVNTEDGENHWKEQIWQLSPAKNLSLNCDHIKQYILEQPEIGSPGSPLRRVVARESN